jgi:hypothetical protein
MGIANKLNRKMGKKDKDIEKIMGTKKCTEKSCGKISNDLKRKMGLP